MNVRDFIKMLMRIDQNELILGVSVTQNRHCSPELWIHYSNKLGEGFSTKGYDRYKLATHDHINTNVMTDCIRDYATILEAWIRMSHDDCDSFDEIDTED